MGIMFITVKVLNAAIRQTTSPYNVIGLANITYRFYYWGILVEENILWNSSRTATYYVAGWIFDLDYDSQSSTFNYAYTSTVTYLGKDSPIIFKDDMEASDTPTRWSTGSLDATAYGTGTNCWEWGAPTSGPDAAYSGQYLWATNLDGDYPDYSYCYLQSPEISLPSSAELQINLTFWHWYDFEPHYDGGWVEISTDGGQTWQQIDPIDGPAYSTNLRGDITYETDRAWTGSSDGWVKSVFNLTAYTGQTIMIRFVFFSDFSITRAGWYIDDVYIILSEPLPQITDYGEITDTKHVAFFHETASNGIGMTIINEEMSGIKATSYIVWHSEADESTDDYIFWARNLSDAQISSEATYKINYAVIPWLPAGTTTSERLSGFIAVNNSVQNPLQYTSADIERYKILVSVKVSDAENQAIENSNVSFYVGSSLVCSALTNACGYTMFDVVRQAYNITVTIKSANATYEQTQSVDLSTINYTQHTYLVTFSFSLYHVKIQAWANISGNLIRVQEGYFEFYTTSFCIAGYTDIEGWIDVYISGGNWTFRFNATKTATPDPYDNITIYNDSSFTNVVAGPGIELTLAINQGVTWYLRDLDLEAQAITVYVTYLNVITTPSPIVVYWNEEFDVSVKLQLENGTGLSGTIYWYIFCGSQLIMSGSGATTNGWYNFTVNTSSLNVGTYILYINATPPPSTATEKYLKPSPVEKTITIKERITDLSVTFSPATSIYWNESLALTVYYIDHFSGNYISEATIKVAFICGSVSVTYLIDEISPGQYELKISNFIHPAGTYIVIIHASKQNYESIEETYSVTINLRLTVLEYYTYIELPWQNNYTIWAKYIDKRYSIAITNATVTFTMKDSSGNIIRQGQLYWNNTCYVYTIDLANLREGIYRIELTAEKDNYELASGVITFYLRVRRTSLTPDKSKVAVTYGCNITVRFYYFDIDLEPSSPVINADYHRFTISIPGGKEIISGILIDLNNGTYLLNINSSEINQLGVFNITVRLSKEHYEPRSMSILVEINPIPTEESAETTIATTEWGVPIDVIINYTRRDGSEIRNANATFVVKYGDDIKYKGKLIEIGDGVYRLYINSSNIVNETNYIFGTYTIYVYLEKRFHENQTIVITWTIEKITSYCNPKEIPIELEYGENVTITYKLWYYRNDYEIFIVGARAVVHVLRNNTIIYTARLLELGNGLYLLNLNVSEFINISNPELGAYTLKVIFTKKYFKTAEAIISLTVNPISTVAMTNPTNITIYWGEEINITVDWRTLKEYHRIPHAIVKITVKVEGINISVPKNAIIIEEIDGTYILYINSSLLTDGLIYEIEVTFEKQFYQTQTCSAYVTVKPIPATAVLSTTELKITWGEDANVSITIIDTYGKGISDVEITIVDTIPEGSIYTTEIGDGKYMIIVKGGLLSAGTNYTLYLEFRKEHYDIPPERLLIVVEKVKVKIEVETPTTIWKSISPFDYGKASSKLIIRVFEVPTNVPVNIIGEILLDGKSIGWINETVLVSPGIYEILISWDRVEPGTYRLGIQINTIIRGKYQGTWEFVVSPIIYVNGVKSDYLGAVVNVDFISGHERIPGIGPVPKVYFWSLVGIALVLSGIGIMKFIAWWRLPPEVKEVIRIIKMVKRGVYEYKVPPRREFLMTLIKTELELA